MSHDSQQTSISGAIVDMSYDNHFCCLIYKNIYSPNLSSYLHNYLTHLMWIQTRAMTTIITR